MVSRAVLMKTGLRSLNTVRPVNTAHPKTTVYSGRPMSHFSKSTQSLPKAVNTARPNSAVVNAVRANQSHPQKEDQGYVDSGCSRHMIGNMSCLLDFKEFDGGYLADESQVLLKVPRKNNMYSVDMKNIIPKESLTCLIAKDTLDESMLWHRRLGHVNFKTINKLVKENLVRGLPTKRFENDQTCVACFKGKQHKASCKSKVQNSITQPFLMLHMDLFSPTFVSSLMNKKYCLVVTDDYSRFTWVFFLASKDETSGILKSFITEIENLVDKKVKIIICDNGTKFKNRVMSEFCEKKGIKKEFSVARTPQQNGVAERRNRTLIEAARTMLADSKLPTTFWAEAVNTACYVQNRVLVVKPHNKTPYELFRGRTPALSFMRPFRCHVTILNTLDYLGKFDGKSDEGFFVRYSLNSKDFRVYNIRTRKVKENLHIRFLEDKPIIAGNGPKWLFDIDVLTKSMNYVSVVAGINSNDLVGTKESIGAGHSVKETGSIQDYILMPLWKEGLLFYSLSKNDSNDEPQPSSDDGKKEHECVNKDSGIDDQERLENITTALLEATHADFFSDETEIDMSNITTTYLVPSTPNTRIHKYHLLDHVIGDMQSGVQTRRMTKTSNEQGFNNDVYKGKTHEDLHTCLFACFLSQEEPKIVIQALKDPSWIKVMQEELLNKKDERDARIEAIRVLGEVPDGSSMGELTFFLGLKVTQKDEGIFISQDKYVDEILKKFGLSIVKIASTPMETSKPLMKDENAEDVDVHLYRSMIGSWMYLTSSRPDIMFVDSPFDLEAYTDSDYAGASLDRKSTTEGCQFLGSRLISCQCKKQTVVANSTTEAEYVAAASCSRQILWIQNQMLDYGYNFMNTKIFIDNESTICIVKNPVFYSKTKHIEIRHSFIRDSNEKKLI
ncbi:putative ribonuclease H-like domain-containing protein [Tanacetum coccineum]